MSGWSRPGLRLGAGLAACAMIMAGCSSSPDDTSGAGSPRPSSPSLTPGPSVSGTPTVTPSASPTTVTPTPTTSGAPSATPSRSRTSSPRPQTTPRPGAGTTTAKGRWQPRPGLTWQWQLTGTIDTSVPAQVYDLDLFTTPASTVTALHRQGRKVICYVSVGASEDFRPDHGRFPASVLGAENGWEGERWLDIRRTDVLLPIMAARFDLCRAKGFDAVEPDNVDGYANDSGFPLSAADQLRYNRALAALAHERGLAVGLKNDLDQIPALVSSFDFAVNEQCFEYDECDALTPFIRAGKAVFHVEYERSTAQFCPTSAALQLSSLRKRLDLDAWRETC